MKTRTLLFLLLSALPLPAFAGAAVTRPSPTPTPAPNVIQSATATLLWNANAAADNVTTYNLYEKIGAVWMNIGSAPAAPAPTFTVQNLAPGPHTYAVTAVNAVAESLRSNEVTTNIPNAPTNLRVTITLNLATP